jgi:hypothetical protein
MADPAATLRALADACEECDRISKDDTPGATDDLYADQKQALADALPGLTWLHAISELRAMADTVDRLTRERDEARALLATPKPRRDPLTDPRPGDVVRWDGITSRITGRGPEGVTYVSLSSGMEWSSALGPWRDWTGFEVEVLHTADEVTP